MGNWLSEKNFGMGVMIVLFGLMFFVYFISLGRQNDESTVIKAQLEAIFNKKFTEAYYTYTSKDFQAATSLKEFKQFVSYFPVLSEKFTASYEKVSGKIKVNLKGNLDSAIWLYTLLKTDKGWLVQKIESLDKETKLENLPDFDVEIFKIPIMEHLNAIRKGELKKAYQNYTTNTFQESTNFKDFETFINNFPVFSNYMDLEYKKLNFNNNIGTYDVLMKESNGKLYILKYDLIAEEGVWKILQIQISELSKE